MRYLAIVLVFLAYHCSENSRKNIQSRGKTDRDSSVVSAKFIQIHEVKPPIVTNPDTCPKPLTIKIPVVKGGSYIINYETGPVKIDLLPPGERLLPVSKEVRTGKPIANPEAQGIGFFTTFTTDQGLALDGITDGICDNEGYLWFCTAGGGVSRYDGKSFVNFTPSQGLANNSVWCVTRDNTGNIWFGTQGGASRYDGKTFTNFDTGQGLPNNIIRSAATDRSGNIWFGTNGGGISRYDGTKFSNYSTEQGLANNYIYDILEDNSGNLWFCTVGGGISRYDGKTFKTFSTRDGLAGDVVVSNCEDKSGNLWFGTYGGGVSYYDGKTFRNFTTSDGLASNTVWKISCDSSGNVWFGTDGGGVSRFDGESFTNFTTSQGLSNNSIWCIVEDNSGNLWFGTLGGGVCRYNGKSFTSFTTSQGLPNNLARSIIEDKDGNMWFGTDQGGISRYNGKSITSFSISQGLVNETVWSVQKDTKGNIWVGTAGGGIARFDGTCFTNFSTEQGLANPIIRCIIEDRKGNMWFGSWLGGVSKYDGKTFTTYTADQGLANNSILDIAEDRSGNLWFCTYGSGISFFDGKTFRTLNISNGLVSNNVKCATEDSAGNLWFGTEGGISFISKRNLEMLLDADSLIPNQLFSNYTTKEGLPNNFVMEIIQSRDGIIYAGTNHGICEIIIDKDGSLETGNVYSSGTGYPVKDVNSGFNTIYEDTRGIIWIGTGSDKTAVVRFDPKAIVRNSRAPEVILQNVKINNENICWSWLLSSETMTHNDSLAVRNEEYLTFGRELSDADRSSMRNKFADIRFDSVTKFFPVPQNLELPYARNNVTFEFNALEPGRHSMIRYQYMLEGYDRVWNPVSDKTTASFGNINEGTYTLMIKACSPDGVWSEPFTYTFRVLPPWYRTWFMYFIYIAVFIGALYSFYRWRVASLRRKNLILEEKVKLRTVELQQANKEIEAQRDLVTRQKEHIEEIHKEVTDSIHYAKRLQTSALPNLLELRKLFSDLFILFKPKDVVSGDFYWYSRIGNKVIFTVADCTGHGVPGAFMSMLGISLLKEIVIKQGIIQPDMILNILRDEIIKALGQTGAPGEQKDGMDISICSVSIDTLEMQWSGANLPCLIVREGNLIELKGDKMPIAIYEKMDKFKLSEFMLQKNDIVYLAGDGYHDQFGGPENKKFMSKHFKELLLSVSGKPLEEQRKILDKTLEEWQTGYETKYPQTDDITVLGLKI